MNKMYSNDSSEFAVKKQASVSEQDIELINSISRKKVTEEDVYCFSVILCDNDIDRDHEQFSVDSLNKLSGMFVGKSAIYNHKAQVQNQCARIYYTEVRVMTNEYNSIGEEYCQLFAKAYIPKNKKNEDLISDLDFGIKKEISVGCNIGKKVCSICGGEQSENCPHIAGETYDGAQCYVILNDPIDAYEWSFVAVPSQRRAGVIKQYSSGDNAELHSNTACVGSQDDTDSTETFSKSYDCILKNLDKQSAQILKQHICKLESKAQVGEQYITKVQKDLIKLNAIQREPWPNEILESVIKKMTLGELEGFKHILSNIIKPTIGASQLQGVTDKEVYDNKNNNYLI